MRSSRESLLAGAAALLVAVGVISWEIVRSSSSPPEEDRTPPPAPRRHTEVRAARPAAPPDLPAPLLSPHADGTDAHREWRAVRVKALGKLSWMDDAASLNIILAELWNPDPDIRSAALEASLNFSSRDAIPRLEAAARMAGDPFEKKKLEDAAAHLKLPTLTEVLAERRKASEAKAQP